MEPFDFLKATSAWAPTMPVPVGLTAQAIQPAGWAGGAMKATEREELEGS